KRSTDSIATTVTQHADLRTTRGQEASQEARETPVVMVKDRGVWASAKRQSRHARKPRPSRTRTNGGIADPEGFEPSRAGLEIRSPIRARRRVRPRHRTAS